MNEVAELTVSYQLWFGQLMLLGLVGMAVVRCARRFLRGGVRTQSMVQMLIDAAVSILRAVGNAMLFIQVPQIALAFAVDSVELQRRVLLETALIYLVLVTVRVVIAAVYMALRATGYVSTGRPKPVQLSPLMGTARRKEAGS